MEDFIKYLRRRDGGLELKEDTPTIESSCSEIYFVNTGDWPFYVFKKGSKVKRYVDQFQEQGFGDTDPETLETDQFSVEFDTVNVGTVKGCAVERVNYVKPPKDCD